MECGGGSWETEVSWDLLFEGSVVTSGVVGFYELDLENGDYTLNMFDSFFVIFKIKS